MVLIPWRWYGELSGFSREMNQLFDRFFGHDLADRPWETATYPPMTVAETDEAVVVRLELHGFLPRDLEITFEDEALCIKASATRSSRAGGEARPSTRIRSSFQKTVRMSKRIRADAIEAQFRDGILRVVLPKKAEPTAPRVITIK